MIQFFEFTDVIHSNYGFGFFLFVMAQFIHGLFQSTGGPVRHAGLQPRTRVRVGVRVGVGVRVMVRVRGG